MTETQVEAALDAGASTATFCFAPGTYRMSLTPKSGQTLTGNAVLKGTRVATGWTQQPDGIWVLEGATFNPIVQNPPFEGSTAGCASIPANCHYADLFKNGVRLTRVLADTAPPAGTWHWDYATDKVYVNTSDPNAALMELTNRNLGIDSAGNLTVKGLSLQHYGQYGIEMTTGDVARNVDFSWNHVTGFRFIGGTASIIGGHTHHNGRYGGSCAGSGKLMDGLEFSFNNILGFGGAPGKHHSGGAIKCVYTTNFVVRNVYSHDNQGSGFWLDIANTGTLIENSRFNGNDSFGLFYEISCTAEVRTSTFRNNASDGIWVHSSTDGNIHNNTFGGNGDAAVEINDNTTRQAKCASEPGAYGNQVHDNILNGDAVEGCVAPRNQC
jgi:hypothetical protein